MVYADVDGNIGYQCTGLYPVRRQGDGTIPAPGWTPEHEWDGWIPFEELPWALNPDEGFLATANQRVHDDTYPFLIGHDFLPPYRARRIAALLSATDPHTKESFARMQVDTVSLPAREIVPLLLEIAPDDDPQKEALSLLAEWDGDLGVDSAGAALYEAWCKHIARAVLLPKLGEDLFDHFHGRRHWTNSFQYQALPSMLRFPSAAWFGGNGVQARDGVLRRALGDAIEELTAPLGGDMAAWRWGALHKVRFAHQLAMLPGLDELFVGGVVESGGDEQTILQGAFEPGVDYSAVVIPSWRQIIDLSDPDAAIGMHTTGQSGHPASEHWRDFVGQWSRGEYHPLPFTRPAVEGAAASRLVLAPDD
jgi:penicillin amidase